MGERMTFPDASATVAYLGDLGVSHLYLSPIWKPRSGSTHNYDVVDPNALDPRIGTRAELRRLAATAKRRGMGIVCDIVPNHMAASHENPWWWDVLAHGRRSRYADRFDIDWDAGADRVVLPVLADEPERVLDDLVVERSGDGAVLAYHEHRFPLVGADGDRVTLDLLDRQAYRLAYWRTGSREINYRRFFDINDLVATRMDTPEIVAQTHALAVELLNEGTIDGVRVDHVDGLRDPAGYLRMLGDLVPDGTYVVVEKILAPDERLPSWTCHGTTGYEFADAVETAGVDPRGARRLRRFASATTGDRSTFATTARRAKREVLETLFPAELDGVARRVEPLGTGRISRARIRRGIVQATSALDVYRTYVTSRCVAAPDGERIETALGAVRDDDVRALLAGVLLVRGRRADDRIDAVARWQQLCAPAAAKGVEDTALYRDVALLSRNEVGGDPARPATTTDELHAFLAERRESWPGAMSGSSTHDSKRGEDVRARLDVLSELPERWAATTRRWMRMNASARAGTRGRPAPDRSDELMLYQTLVGSWTIRDHDRRGYADRVAAAMQKAIREAKRRTSWLEPDESYEAATDGFVRTILADERFTDDLAAFAEHLALHGAVNSLARVVIKAAAPGAPDVYQGAELWHLRLVDPDNRAAVDFSRRSRMLEAMAGRFERDPGRLVRDLLRSWTDGRVKLFVTWRALGARANDPELFTDGSYVPLRTSGPRARNVIAFARRLGPRWAIVCVPRLSTQVCDGTFPLADAWDDTLVHVPESVPQTLRDTFTSASVGVHDRTIDARDAFAHLPVSLLVSA